MELISHLHKCKVIELGRFVLKNGTISPIYIDLRILPSHITILELAAQALCERIKNESLQFDYIVGVPVGALLLAGFTARLLQKPILIVRKEQKSHGKMLPVEGRFEVGKTALVIEDVITSGSSVLNAVEILRESGLICRHMVCMIDREQGAVENLIVQNISAHIILSITSILEFLVKKGEITDERRKEIRLQLQNPEKVDNIEASQNDFDQLILWNPERGLTFFPAGSINHQLTKIILKKKTNICLAVDIIDPERILEVADKTSDYICALKLHCDIINGFSPEFTTKLKRLSNDNEFLIVEDRKLGDTAQTMEQQLVGGPFRIAEWADLVTAHSVQGSASIASLSSVLSNNTYKTKGILLVAQMSTEGSLTNDTYFKESIEIAEKNCSLVSGFVCQRRINFNPNFLCWTPGVNSSETTDGKGQKWRSIENAIIADHCDIAIVGRAITSSSDIVLEAKRYAEIGWNALMSRSNVPK